VRTLVVHLLALRLKEVVEASIYPLAFSHFPNLDLDLADGSLGCATRLDGEVRGYQVARVVRIQTGKQEVTVQVDPCIVFSKIHKNQD
jgi:hypothetical protein